MMPEYGDGVPLQRLYHNHGHRVKAKLCCSTKSKGSNCLQLLDVAFIGPYARYHLSPTHFDV